MKKLRWTKWVQKNFNKNDDENYYTSLDEIDRGTAPFDLSHWKQKEVEEKYAEYLKSDEE